MQTHVPAASDHMPVLTDQDGETVGAIGNETCVFC